MNLDTVWKWEKKGLPCKVRMETGNPGADELRERICEILNVDFQSFQRHYLVDHETAVEKSQPPVTKGDEKHAKVVVRKRPASVESALRRINTSLILFNQSDAVRPVTAVPKGMPMTRRNLCKKFIEVPKSPPRRALYDLKMNRLNMAVK